MESIKVKDPNLIKKLNIASAILSVLIPGVVLVLLTPGLIPKLSLPFSPYVLPPFYATINAITAVILVLAVYFVKQKKIQLHMRLIYVAMGLSIIFLISYILYHWSAEPTSFGGEGPIRGVYYFILISHIILSGVVVPFVLFTFVRGFTGQVEKHRKLAKWTFPLWFYVAVSGVVSYLMLAPYYPN